MKVLFDKRRETEIREGKKKETGELTKKSKLSKLLFSIVRQKSS